MPRVRARRAPCAVLKVFGMAMTGMHGLYLRGGLLQSCCYVLQAGLEYGYLQVKRGVKVCTNMLSTFTAYDCTWRM